MVNEGIEIIGIAEVNINWSKIIIKENIYSSKDIWFKERSIITGYNKSTLSDGPFQSGDTAIMAVGKVSCRTIKTGKEFSKLGCWSWMLLRGKKNIRTIIITVYCPIVSASTGGAYSQQLETLAIMIIHNDLSSKFWIDLNKDTSKWIHQGEQIILMWD